eukprot:7824291-Pyramimonas_sp.AAC.1
MQPCRYCNGGRGECAGGVSGRSVRTVCVNLPHSKVCVTWHRHLMICGTRAQQCNYSEAPYDAHLCADAERCTCGWWLVAYGRCVDAREHRHTRPAAVGHRAGHPLAGGAGGAAHIR